MYIHYRSKIQIINHVMQCLMDGNITSMIKYNRLTGQKRKAQQFEI